MSFTHEWGTTMKSSWSRIFGTLVCSALLAAPASAQEAAAVGGRVVDRGSNLPISDANVVVVGTQRGARTNEQGRYRIAGVPAGTPAMR